MALLYSMATKLVWITLFLWILGGNGSLIATGFYTILDRCLLMGALLIGLTNPMMGSLGSWFACISWVLIEKDSLVHRGCYLFVVRITLVVAFVMWLTGLV